MCEEGFWDDGLRSPYFGVMIVCWWKSRRRNLSMKNSGLIAIDKFSTTTARIKAAKGMAPGYSNLEHERNSFATFGQYLGLSFM
jgi:hypothetical protein